MYEKGSVRAGPIKKRKDEDHMKKFLSLLLAMTMVMSLIVLPARAGENPPAVTASTGAVTITADKTSVVEGQTVTYTITSAKITDSSGTDHAATVTSATWTPGGTKNENTITVTAPADTYTLGVSAITLTASDESGLTLSDSAKITVTAPQVTVTSKSETLRNAITSITYNGRPVTISNDRKSVTYYTLTNDSSSEGWKASATGFTEVLAELNSTTLTVKGKNGDSQEISTTFSVAPVAASVTLSNPTNPTISKNATGCGTTSITATCNGFTAQSYTWYDGQNVISNATSATLNWTPAVTATDGNHTIKCVVKYGSADNQKIDSDTKTVNIESETYDIRATATPTNTTLGYIVANSNQSSSFPAINLYKVTTPATPVAVSPAVSFTYSKVSDPSNAINLNTSNGTFTVTGSGTATLRATTSYKGKPYSKDLIVYASALSADLSRQVYYGNPVTYSYSDLIEAANKALSGSYGYGSYYGTVTTIVSASAPVSLSNLGTFTGSISNNSGYIYATASYSGRGKAPITATVKTSTGQPVTVTLNIPVVPIPTTFDSLTAEPVTTNYTTSINNYRITFPSTYSTYYVVQKNGTTAPDYATASLVGNAYSSSTPYTLTSADFTNGQCTLYVIATNSYTYGSSYGTYYSGAITVTQTNHDIKYNGVVGGTVQFKHNDFTTFMNEMYGTNTTSYLTFNSVKFTSVPNATTQGTLYYNGVAMTTGYGSNYFNTSTAVTNLDNVSFSVSSKVPSTTKEIRIPFTLYATRYNSYGTSAGTSVTYSGVVVISLVREDVTFTVAPGDSVRFTDSAFLTYLRSASGINYNYNIDYVTFDQSAVNALNEGVLYAYSTGFNAVKTTDRFYYTTTSYNQNALSDVTFRASTYAKTGTTVYIPFTITAKYGMSSATRQVTGTVAIKIAQTMNFVDVKPTDYFYDSVKWAVNDNITKGTSATTFSPNNTCTRAEIVTFLWRAAGSPTPTITRNPFTDVKYPVGSDFYNAILWASQNGIAAGTSTTTFAPNDNCTRAQIVTFLWRYAKKPLGYYTNPFNDVNKTEYAAYYDAILWAAGKGIATGNTPKTFNPDGTCTRAEAVTFLYRYESTK